MTFAIGRFAEINLPNEGGYIQRLEELRRATTLEQELAIWMILLPAQSCMKDEKANGVKKLRGQL